MPTYVVTDPATGRKVKLTGDTPPTDEDLDEIFASLPAPKQAAPAQTPAVPKEDKSFLQSVGDAGLEFAAGVNRGATGLVDLAAKLPNAALQLAGSDKQIPSLAKALSGATAGQFMEPGLGRDVVGAAGEVIPAAVGGGALLRGAAQSIPAFGASGNAAAPLAGQGIAPNVLKQMGASTMAQDAGYGALSGAGGKLGEATGKAVGGETGGQVGSLLGSIAAPAGVLLGANAVKGMGARAAEQGARLAAGSADRDLAKVMLDPAAPAVPPGAIPGITPGVMPKAVADKAAKEAVKQGFDDGLVAAVKATNPTTRKKMLEMTNIAERGKKNLTEGASSRPADVVGDSLAERIKYVKKVNTDAGKQLDDVAERNLRGQPAEADEVVKNFTDSLRKMGVYLNDDNVPNFKLSDIEGLSGPEQAIRKISARLKPDNLPDAYQMHRLKRYIDEIVTPGSGAGTEGLKGKAERVLMGLRKDIDSTLDKRYPEYDKVNTQYSETIGALDSFQKAAGTSVNLFGDNSDKALGTVSRRLLSNAQSRVNLMDSIKSVDDVSKKYGATFDDDIMTQVLFADELDSMFGAAAKTSLQGDVGKGVRRGVDMATGNSTLVGLAKDAAVIGVDKARGINEENAFKAMKQLLSREAAK